MRFGSICSGIEAASVAWNPLGWKAAWFSEIEPFPSALLAYRYPDVPNLGDMTALPQKILNEEIEAPELICGGTPCQAFSVAGQRKSLDDERGNLTLIFCEIVNAVEKVRKSKGLPPLSCSGKTSPESSTPKITPSAALWETYLAVTFPLRYPQADGKAAVLFPVRKDKSRGGFWTLNISECPNDGKESLLSQVLETDSIPKKYFLSSKACAGILRRAKARNKILPDSLKVALERSMKQELPELVEPQAEL